MVVEERARRDLDRFADGTSERPVCRPISRGSNQSKTEPLRSRTDGAQWKIDFLNGTRRHRSRETNCHLELSQVSRGLACKPCAGKGERPSTVPIGRRATFQGPCLPVLDAKPNERSTQHAQEWDGPTETEPHGV